MNTKKIVFALSLGMIILSGCGKDEIDWGANGVYDTSLNATETKLRFSWRLQSISTIDSLYVDSSFIKGRYLFFESYSFSKNGRPQFSDHHTGISMKMVPNKILGAWKDGEYNSPDSSHLKIVTYVDNFDNRKALDSSLLKIMTLTTTKLNLRDTISNIQWNFVR